MPSTALDQTIFSKLHAAQSPRKPVPTTSSALRVALLTGVAVCTFASMMPSAHATAPTVATTDDSVGQFIVDAGDDNSGSSSPAEFTIFLDTDGDGSGSVDYSTDTDKNALKVHNETFTINDAANVTVNFDGGADDSGATDTIATLTDHDLSIGALTFDLTAADGGSGTDRELLTVVIGDDNQVGSLTSDDAIGLNFSGGGSTAINAITVNNDGKVYGHSKSDGAEAAGISIGNAGSVGTVDINLGEDSVTSSGNDGIRLRNITGSATIDLTSDGSSGGASLLGADGTGTREGYGLRVSNFWTSPDSEGTTSVAGDLTLTNGGFIDGVAGDVYIEEVRGQTTLTNTGNIGTNGSLTPIAVTIRNVGNDTSDTDAVVVNNNGGTVEGEQGFLISGVQSTSGIAETGDVRITNQNGGQILGQAGAAIVIDVSEVGSDDLGVADDLRISNLGTTSLIQGVSSTSADGDGIELNQIGGNVIVSNEGIIRGTNPSGNTREATGLDMDGGGSIGGSFNLTNSGTISGYHDAVDMNGIAGSVTIVNSGTISAETDDSLDFNGVGFDSDDSPAAVTFSLNNSGNLIAGSGGRLTIENIGNSQSGSSVAITIDNSGTIRNVDSDTDATAINIDNVDSAETNTVVINNTGTIIGQLDFGDSGDEFGTDSGSNSIDLNNAGTWRVSGSSAFSVSSDDYEDDVAVSIDNTGTIEIAGNTTMSDIDVFDNAGGTIDLTQDDNATDSVFEIDLTGSGAGFRGQRSSENQLSTVKVDANLGASNQSSLQSDRFAIDGDDADGVTRIAVTDTQPTVAGVYSPNGVQVVLVDGNDTTDKGAFVLSTDPINKGLWAYDLHYAEGDSGQLWLLASAPSEQAHELPVLLSGGQEAWLQGASAFTDYSTHTRLGFEDGEHLKGGAWARVFGGEIERDNTNRHVQAVYGTSSSYRNAYDQDISGVLFGADRAINGDNGGTWLLGLMAGATRSDLVFSTSTTEMDLTAASLGAYASFIGNRGGFFNAMLKGDIGTTDYSMDAGNQLTHTDSLDTMSIGAKLDTGYRFRTGVAFFEPSISVAAVSTDIEEANFLKTQVDFGSSEAIRTRLGFSTGVSADWGSTTWEPYFSVTGVNDSGDDNAVRLTSGGESTSVKDTQVENYVEGTLGLRIVGSEGSYGYLRVDHTPSSSSDDAAGDAKRESTAVSLGLKVTW